MYYEYYIYIYTCIIHIYIYIYIYYTCIYIYVYIYIHTVIYNLYNILYICRSWWAKKNIRKDGTWNMMRHVQNHEPGRMILLRGRSAIFVAWLEYQYVYVRKIWGKRSREKNMKIVFVYTARDWQKIGKRLAKVFVYTFGETSSRPKIGKIWL